MSAKIKELAIQAGLIAPYGSDREGLADFDYRKFADLIIQDCYVALFPALRDMISRGQAYEMIRQHFDADSLMVAAEHMSDKGYELSTHEKQAEFAAKRNYTYSDIISDGGMDPRDKNSA
jgi:hypothetical protein